MQTFASVLSRLFLSTSVLVLGIGITTASAQPSLNPVSPSGTLIYTLTSGPVSQCGPEGQLTYQEYTYSSLQYQNNGKNYSIPGSSSVRLEVEQHQLVGRTYSHGSVEIGLQGA